METNAQNIQINVFDINTDINSKGFQEGIGVDGWYGNTAGKAMIDNMNANKDPRLPILFEPGLNAAGKFIGIDPLATEAVQTAQYQCRYRLRFTTGIRRATTSFSPVYLINAPQMNLIKAEYYLRTGERCIG